MNGTVVKNQLIFDFASGILGPAKSLFASTYLQLNSSASKIGTTFENMLGENLMDNENIHPKNLCIFVKICLILDLTVPKGISSSSAIFL